MDLSEITSFAFAGIISDYCAFFEESPIEVNISITQNLFDGYKKIRPDLTESNLISADRINNNNGITILPQSGDVFTILLSYEYLKENMKSGKPDWLGTIAHELTHVYDYMEYKAITGRSYGDMLEYQDNIVFVNWTEFNAKVKGYLFLRKNCFDDIYDRTQVSYIFDKELPFLTKNMIADYNESDNANEQLYTISHFLAHFYVWQHLFPNDFTDRVLDKMLGSNIWVKKLYHFFSDNRKLEDAINNAEQFKNILRTNFKGI